MRCDGARMSCMLKDSSAISNRLYWNMFLNFRW